MPIMTASVSIPLTNFPLRMSLNLMSWEQTVQGGNAAKCRLTGWTEGYQIYTLCLKRICPVVEGC